MAVSVFCALLVLINVFGVQFRADAESPPESGKTVLPAPNVALNGISKQSSTNAYYGNSQNAIDGSLENNYLRSQCSYTKKELAPWWMVDLRNNYRIFSVAITNRVLECCKERIYGAEIRIGNDPKQGGRLNPRCGVISSMESGETLSFSCQGMVGQYVTVTIPGREEHLVLCEVQVFGVPDSILDVSEVKTPDVLRTPNGAPNVALKGIANQSTLYNMYGESKNAIDGSLSSNYLFIECAGTSEQDDPWWMVDLKSTFKIFTVAVTNRGDCCADRINGAQIRIGNTQDQGGTHNPICGAITTMNNGQTLAFECNGMEGRYVTVFNPGSKQSLTICEVQVFGLPSEVTEPKISPTGVIPLPDGELPVIHDSSEEFAYIFKESEENISPTDSPEDGENLAFRGISSQSSTYDKFGDAENAIDGSTNTRYMSGHCSHTDLDIEPWWRMDLTDTFNVTTVKITNRGDCCKERINGAEIRIGNIAEMGGTMNPRCTKIESLGLGEEHTYSCGMIGRYVTVIIPGIAAYLTLCEVKVYGYKVSENITSNLSPSFHNSEEDAEFQAASYLRNIQKYSNAAPNIALLGLTSQSSTDEEGESKNAADGSLKNKIPASQCAKTKEEFEPWWTVDLKSDFTIFSIAVTNRGDCCAQDLDGAEIHIGNSATGWKKNPICDTVPSIGLGETFLFDCNRMKGRFVTIAIPGNNASLTLCEVQVFALSVNTPNIDGKMEYIDPQNLPHGVPNVAPKGIPSQSSYYGYSGEDKAAIDGSLSSNYMSGECSHTRKESSPWWRLDLKSTLPVYAVAITNRGDCCRERINGAEILVGDSEEKGGIGNPRCGTVFKMGYGETLSFNCKGMLGRYVTVTIPDHEEFLTLCEVQVFAKPGEVGTTPETTSHSDELLSSVPPKVHDLTDKSLFFPGESSSSYVHLSPATPMDLTAFTLCMKLSLDVPENRETILFSYRTLFYDELNLWLESNGNIGVYMRGESLMLPPLDQSKEWNHLCLTWESKHGRCELWVNNKRSATRVYQKKHKVKSGGIVLLGQDQDTLGDNFDASQSYVGKIKDLNMWDKVISLKSLHSLFKEKEFQQGNIFDWGSLNYIIKGNVTIV